MDSDEAKIYVNFRVIDFFVKYQKILQNTVFFEYPQILIICNMNQTLRNNECVFTLFEFFL